MKNKYFYFFTIVILSCCSLSAQSLLYNPAHVYDTVTDSVSYYYFPLPKPCFEPTTYGFATGDILLQEYVTSDTLTVYGVALTFTNEYGDPIYDDFTGIQGVLMTPLGPSWGYYYAMQPVDSVTLNRSHPRYCWFVYEDDCNEKQSMTVPCYEFYFDTPEQINQMTDTFYVGYERGRQLYRFHVLEYGGRYSNSLPGRMYAGPGRADPMTGGRLDMFHYCNYYTEKFWGIAFPIIGFRCGPIRQYWLDAYTGDSATVRWRSVEEGTLYNVRLVGEDGSDTTYITADTTILLTPLSDSVRYNVMLRKQCHYATSNYDTTVYGQWLSYLSFGTTILPDTTSGGGGNEGIEPVESEGFSLRPNPASGTVQVVLPYPIQTCQAASLQICDLEGHVLIERTVNDTTMDLDISALPVGTYLVKLSTPSGTVTKKLLVQ